jgi:hypothetical protein
MRRRQAQYFLYFLLLCTPGAAKANIFNLGIFSFDGLIPDGATPGVNIFDIYNFTGPVWSLPAAFPVITALTLRNVTVTLNGMAGTQIIPLGDIAPGLFTPPPSIEFADTRTFTSVTLTADLSSAALMLFNGGTSQLPSDVVTATILPSIGPNLAAGTDLTVISATTTPEPAMGVILGGSLLTLVAVRKKCNAPPVTKE